MQRTAFRRLPLNLLGRQCGLHHVTAAQTVRNADTTTVNAPVYKDTQKQSSAMLRTSHRSQYFACLLKMFYFMHAT